MDLVRLLQYMATQKITGSDTPHTKGTPSQYINIGTQKSLALMHLRKRVPRPPFSRAPQQLLPHLTRRTEPPSPTYGSNNWFNYGLFQLCPVSTGFMTYFLQNLGPQAIHRPCRDWISGLGALALILTALFYGTSA